MALSFHTTCSGQTFLELAFFLLSYILLTLRFWAKICLTLPFCQLTANHPGQVREPYRQFFLTSLCYRTCLYHFLPGTKLPASRKNSWGECFYTKDFPPFFSPIKRIWQHTDDTVRLKFKWKIMQVGSETNILNYSEKTANLVVWT